MAAARAAASKAKATLEALSARFDVEVHKKNAKGFTYIPIESVIGRFNEVCGAGWSMSVKKVEYMPTPNVTYGNRNPKPGAAAFVTVSITIADLDGMAVTREGVGGDFGAADDVDKLVKTALAEAIKKAGNQFGIGLYLWDEEERALIDAAAAQGMTGQVVAAGAQQAPAGLEAPVGPVGPVAPLVSVDELTELKNKVADLAVAQGADRTGPAIAAHFGIPVEALQDAGTLRTIISNAVAG